MHLSASKVSLESTSMRLRTRTSKLAYEYRGKHHTYNMTPWTCQPATYTLPLASKPARRECFAAIPALQGCRSYVHNTKILQPTSLDQPCPSPGLRIQNNKEHEAFRGSSSIPELCYSWSSSEYDFPWSRDVFMCPPCNPQLLCAIPWGACYLL